MKSKTAKIFLSLALFFLHLESSFSIMKAIKIISEESVNFNSSTFPPGRTSFTSIAGSQPVPCSNLSMAFWIENITRSTTPQGQLALLYSTASGLDFENR
eukprot:TRINITY_DN5563_c0_g3_i6.p2 TRINITY_DN5563_c0_g3~~TRINITY_DN5563_c0_g3_i6.p2  ORF type:complete len:100 (+),score=12.80 TRINITY_DN5563_c0_g3_i6:32-331(+)